MHIYRFKREKDDTKASRDLFLMHGKFLSDPHNFKDCQIEIRYQNQSIQESLAFDEFEVSNIIALNKNLESLKTRDGDKIRIFFILKRNGATVDRAYVDVEIGSKMFIIRESLNLLEKSFKSFFM